MKKLRFLSLGLTVLALAWMGTTGKHPAPAAAPSDEPPLPSFDVSDTYRLPPAVVKETKIATPMWSEYSYRLIDSYTMQIAGSFARPYQAGVIFFDNTSDNTANSVLVAAGVIAKQKLHGPSLQAQWYRVAFPKDRRFGPAIDFLNAQPSVRYAGPNWLAQGGVIPNDPQYPNQWDLPKINAPSAWDITKGSSTTIIATVDTGVDMNHADISGKLVTGSNCITPGSQPQDDHGHGTCVSSVAGATTNNPIPTDMASLGWLPSVMPVKSLNSNNTGDDTTISCGINFAASNGAHVINVSIHNMVPDTATMTRAAINNAVAKGSVVVGITGNAPFTSYPGAFPDVISTGATDMFDQKASFSNSTPTISVSAPGEGIICLRLGGGTSNGNAGTSFAAPHVSALAALLLTQAPSIQSKIVSNGGAVPSVVLGAKHLIEDNATERCGAGF